jgi:hypothetical protein
MELFWIHSGIETWSLRCLQERKEKLLLPQKESCEESEKKKRKEQKGTERKSDPSYPSKPISRSFIALRNLVLLLSVVAFSTARHMILGVEGKQRPRLICLISL